MFEDINMKVSQNEGYLFGVPITGTIVCWGLYCGPPNMGNYHIRRLHVGTIWTRFPGLAWDFTAAQAKASEISDHGPA